MADRDTSSPAASTAPQAPPEADSPLLCACGVYADRCDAPACGACEIEANYPPGSLIDLNEELRGYWA